MAVLICVGVLSSIIPARRRSQPIPRPASQTRRGAARHPPPQR